MAGGSAATSADNGDLNNHVKSDKSGLFQLGNITVATGRSSISQRASAADGIGATAGGLNPWLIVGAVLAMGAFAFILMRQR